MRQFYPKNGRVILHVDMNSFFASVEMAYDPSLKGKPLAIAGDVELRKGIVVTCSYEARKFGVKTTMPVWQAKKLCPSLIIKKPDFPKYRLASNAMFDELRRYTGLVEPGSIDEGYVDITGCHEIGSPMEIAESIQQNLLSSLDLPCSIGIAPNKFLAKMASDLKKPLGITVLRKRDLPHVLWPMPVIEMHGVGEKTAEKLGILGIKTIGDLAGAEEDLLRRQLGIRGSRLRERANGIDSRPVDPAAAEESKSIGSSLTLPQDIANQAQLSDKLKSLSGSVAERLRRKGYVTRNISVMIRYRDRKTVTRSRKLLNPISNAEDIFEAARHLFIQHWDGDPVRLLGITGQELLEESQSFEQLSLFSYEAAAKKEPLYKTIGSIHEKFGKTSLIKGSEAKKDR